MNILIVYFNRTIPYDNLYVRSLCEEMQQQGYRATCSIEDFWSSTQTYDIIHIQFPEVIFKWRTPSSAQLQALRNRIETWKSRGSKIVFTRHDAVPHYCNNPVKLELYQIVEEACDCMIHLGEYSRQEFRATHLQNQAEHIVIPHHIYNHSEYNMPSREVARQRLQIPSDRLVILTFGAYRNIEERSLVTNAFQQLPIDNKYLLAPGFYNDCFTNRRTPISNWIKYYRQKKIFHIKAQGRLLHRKLNNTELPNYFAAADIVLIQRKATLNSGNAPMAFFFHRVVAGPNQGNIGELLQQTQNPTFDFTDSNSVVQAILHAQELSQTGHGENNYRFAQQHMSVESVVQKTTTCYQRLLNH